MHLIAALIAGLSLLNLPVPVQTQSPATPDARVQPAPESHALRFSPETLDLGELVAGKPMSGTVTVTNSTDAPLKVRNIGAACGCTTVSKAPMDPVPAGGSFTVDITLNPGIKAGVNLSKAVYFYLEDGATQTLTIKGRVKTVVRVVPDIVDGASPEGVKGAITLESIDKTPFRITSIDPAGVASASTEARATHTMSVDWSKWIAAGRPAKIEIATDKPDAEKLVVLIKSGPSVAMFRMPIEAAAQDAAIHAIDERIRPADRSAGFTMKLHRETGMLFVHGTQDDLDAMRRAVAALPASAGVHESVR
jgi:hypothetical protein